MITEKAHNINWNFFISLEHDLEEISRFIEFSENNFSTYSIELARLLLATSSEVDVVAKQLCKLLDMSASAENIHDYRKLIVSKCPNFPYETIYIERYGLSMQPWIKWSNDKSPHWWNSYNHVKHQRDSHYHEANLQNTINALGALLILLFYYYAIPKLQDNPHCESDDVMNILIPQSTLIHLDTKFYPSHLLANSGHLLSETIKLG